MAGEPCARQGENGGGARLPLRRCPACLSQGPRMHILYLALIAIGLVVLFLGLAATGRAWWGWVLAIGTALFLWGWPAPERPAIFWSVAGLFLLIVLLTGVVPLRQ